MELVDLIPTYIKRMSSSSPTLPSKDLVLFFPKEGSSATKIVALFGSQ